jgi:hypothetical protein
MAVKIARFPCVRDLDGFDLTAAPSIYPHQVRERYWRIENRASDPHMKT